MFHDDYDYGDDRPATHSESVREWAWNAGSDPSFINREYMLHDWDVWVKNPHYTGTKSPHPEDDYFYEMSEDGQKAYLEELNNPQKKSNPYVWPDDSPF